MFFNHMESKTEEYWQDTDLEQTIRDFLETLATTLQSRICPHYFIPSINLWGENILEMSGNEISTQATRGCEMIRKSMNSQLVNFITPLQFRSEILIKNVFNASSTRFYTTALALVLITELSILASFPMLAFCLCVLIQTTLSWLVGMVICLPILVIFIVILLLLRLFFKQ